MKLRVLKCACVAASMAATMVFISPAIAENQTELTAQSLGRLVADAKWGLRLPKENLVSYSGVVSFDSAGMNAQSMLYPAAGGIAGLLAAVITHGVIVDSAKKTQKTQLQVEADKVLLPYQEILNNYTHKELMQRGLEKVEVGSGKRLIESADKAEADWYIESTPMYALTQDQNAIILENTISIYAANAPTEPAYQNTVRVVSTAQQRVAPPSDWTANQGEKIKDESARLFAESLSMVFNDIAIGAAKEGNPHKTVRYMEGANEKMERGQIISEHCDRVVFKTLRGWLMSVPDRRSQSNSTPQCDDKLSRRL